MFSLKKVVSLQQIKTHTPYLNQPKRIKMKNAILLFFGCIASLATNAQNINFTDDCVKTICVENWDTSGDGELSMAEAAAVTDLNTKFAFETDVIRFPELQYFTGLSCISTYDFYSCKNLRSIILPPQITYIGSSAFFGCINLQEIVIPDAVKTLNQYAFNGCSSLRTVTLPEGLTTIGDYAFSACNSLQGIAIPASTTSISASAFWSCSSLTSVTVDLDNTVYDSREDCNAIIKTNTNTLQLGTVSTIIPTSVTTIGASAFYGNVRLQNIDIPEGVKTIGISAFSGCTALTTVTLPSTLTSIGSNAFTGCKKLTSILLPEGLKTISDFAFKGCAALRKIYIPSTVTTIDFYAFSECSRLTKVAAAKASPISIDASVFPYAFKSTLYVSKGSLEAYRNAATWQDFNTIVELGQEITATVEPEEMEAGTEATLTISLANDDFFSYRSVQTDIVLPNNFYLNADDIVLSDRCTGMTVTLNPQEENVYHLTCTSETGFITGTEGTLLTLALHSNDGVAGGEYTGTAQNITLTNDYGKQQPLVDAEFKWNVIGRNTFAMGDVNHDGFVNVTDVSLSVNYILGNIPPVFYKENADIDQDRNVNITDITNLVNLILKKVEN